MGLFDFFKSQPMYLRTKKAQKIDKLNPREREVALNNFNEELSDSFHHLKMKLMQQKHITPEDIQEYIILAYNMWVTSMLLRTNQYEGGLLVVEKCVPFHKLDNRAISNLLFEKVNESNLDSFDKNMIMREAFDVLIGKYNQSCAKITRI